MTEQMPEYPAPFVSPTNDVVQLLAELRVAREELWNTKRTLGILIRKYGKSTARGGHKVSLTDVELMESHPNALITVWRNDAYRTTEIEVVQ